MVKRLSTVDLADHLAEAKAVMAEARIRAARMTSDAEAQAKQLRQSGWEEGRSAGYQEGYAVGVAEGREAAFEEAMERFSRSQEDAVSALRRTVAELDAMKRDLMIAAERDVLEFAIAVARKLTLTIGEFHREAAVENLKESLRMVGAKTHITVHAHPKDVETLRTFATSLSTFIDQAQTVKIDAQESISPGGCRVESDRTKVDATLETQIDAMVSLLTGVKRDHA